MAVLSDVGLLEQGIIDQLSGNDHSLMGYHRPTHFIQFLNAFLLVFSQSVAVKPSFEQVILHIQEDSGRDLLCLTQLFQGPHSAKLGPARSVLRTENALFPNIRELPA